MLARRTLATAAVLFFAVTVAALVATWRVRIENENLARTRMLGLKSKAEGKKPVYIEFNQFQFVYGKPQLVDHITVSNKSLAGLKTPEHARLQDRITRLIDIMSPTRHMNGDLILTTDLPTAKPVAPSSIFGIQAVRIPQADGSVKFLAVFPESCSVPAIFKSLDSLVRKPNYRTYSRSDFVNPEDIDWFFGVKDFSTYTHE